MRQPSCVCLCFVLYWCEVGREGRRKVSGQAANLNSGVRFRVSHSQIALGSEGIARRAKLRLERKRCGLRSGEGFSETLKV